MSLFIYSVKTNDGVVKTGQRTAKNEETLRKRLAAEMKIVEWLSLKEAKPSPTTTTVQAPKTPSNSKLGKMLYLQSGKCFFCGQTLSESDASIEHLHPTSKGGTRTEDNEVICCKALNHTFGNMDFKRKFEFVLKSAGNFKCPMQ